jgi:hypothetical protein
MKRLIFITIVFTFLTAPVLADYYGGRVYYSRINNYYSGNGGEFTLRSDGGQGLLLSNSAYDAKTRGEDGNPESFQTFCVETAEYVAQPMDIVVSTTTAEGITDSHAILGSKPNGDDLDSRTAYLYTQFAKGTLSNYNYVAGVGRSASAGELQKAIWWIEGEGGSNAGQAGIWITEATNAGWTDIGDVRILNTWVPGHIGELGYKTQDQLYLVPVPAAVLLGMLGLGVAGLKLRKSK